MGRAAARMSRKQLAAASGVSERTITAFEHHTSRSITRANNVALRRALEAANVGFTGFGIEVPDRRVPVPPTDEARVERVAEAIYLASKDVPRVWLALGRNHRGSWRKLAVAAIAAY
jgi:transcriptional regulator with XRE-family HTH domain